MPEHAIKDRLLEALQAFISAWASKPIGHTAKFLLAQRSFGLQLTHVDQTEKTLDLYSSFTPYAFCSLARSNNDRLQTNELQLPDEEKSDQNDAMNVDDHDGIDREENQAADLNHSDNGALNEPTHLVGDDNSAAGQEQRQEQERSTDLLQNPTLQSSATITVARTNFSKKVNFEKAAKKAVSGKFLPKKEIFTWAKRENGDPEDG